MKMMTMITMMMVHDDELSLGIIFILCTSHVFFSTARGCGMSAVKSKNKTYGTDYENFSRETHFPHES